MGGNDILGEGNSALSLQSIYSLVLTWSILH